MSACFPHSLTLTHIHTENRALFIAATSAGHMLAGCTLVWASAHHELVRVSLKERCPSLYLLMARVCFSDVSNIIPCYQRLIRLSQFDSCLFGANGQSQSRSWLRTPAQRLMRSALFILSINPSWSEALWKRIQRPDSSSTSGLKGFSDGHSHTCEITRSQACTCWTAFGKTLLTNTFKMTRGVQHGGSPVSLYILILYPISYLMYCSVLY